MTVFCPSPRGLKRRGDWVQLQAVRPRYDVQRGWALLSAPSLATEGTQGTITLMASSRKLCCHLEDQLYLGFSFLNISDTKLSHSMDIFITVMCAQASEMHKLLFCTANNCAMRITHFPRSTSALKAIFQQLGRRKNLQKGETSLVFNFHSFLRIASQNTCIFWQEMPEKQLGSPAPLSAPTRGGTLAWVVTFCVWSLFQSFI